MHTLPTELSGANVLYVGIMQQACTTCTTYMHIRICACIHWNIHTLRLPAREPRTVFLRATPDHGLLRAGQQEGDAHNSNIVLRILCGSSPEEGATGVKACQQREGTATAWAGRYETACSRGREAEVTREEGRQKGGSLRGMADQQTASIIGK